MEDLQDVGQLFTYQFTHNTHWFLLKMSRFQWEWVAPLRHLGIQKFIAGFEVDFEYRPTNLEWPGQIPHTHTHRVQWQTVEFLRAFRCFLLHIPKSGAEHYEEAWSDSGELKVAQETARSANTPFWGKKLFRRDDVGINYVIRSPWSGKSRQVLLYPPYFIVLS